MAGKSNLRLCPDNTGRFPLRPYYERWELDRMCEQAVGEFMEERYGELELPIPTDALTTMIERDVDNLDLYADLSSYGTDVDGATDFRVGLKPEVKIANELGLLLGQGRREYRLRTTLSHEYGHVMLHRGLYDGKLESSKLLDGPACKQAEIITAPGSDWLEWQAGYCSGALLMPITHLNKLVSKHFERRGIYAGTVCRRTSQAGELIHIVSNTFFVSRAAARVRLDQLGFIADHETGPSLFDN